MASRAADRKSDAHASSLLAAASPGDSPSRRSSRLSTNPVEQTSARPKRGAALRHSVIKHPSESPPRIAKRRKKSNVVNDEYAALRIDDENETHYHIVWLGTNPATGKAWRPTWVCSNQSPEPQNKLGQYACPSYGQEQKFLTPLPSNMLVLQPRSVPFS